MRTRSRTSGPTAIGSISIATTSQPWDTVNGTWGATSNSTGTVNPHDITAGLDEITDDPSPGRGNKVVIQNRRKWEYISLSYAEDYSIKKATGIPFGNRTTRSGSFANISQNGNTWGPLLGFSNVSVSYTKTDAQLMAEANHRFMNINEVDNLTNILDAGKTLQLVTQVSNRLENLLFFVKRKNGRFDALGSVRSLLRSGAKLRNYSNGYLAWSYGVAPLLSDLRSMAESMVSLRRDCDKAIRRARAIRSYHASCSGTLSLTSLPANMIESSVGTGAG